MTTDITELAQQELAQLRAELSNQAIGSKDHLRKIALSLVDKLEKCRDREIRWLALSDEKSKIITDQEEALGKAQQVDEELCKLLPPGVEYMDPPDGGDVTPLEGVRRMVADYRQRIAELDAVLEREREKSRRVMSRIAELESIREAAEKLVRCKGRYHSEQNYRALAALFGVKTPDLPPLDSESIAVTVKLTDINDYLAEVHDKTLNRAFRLLAEGVRAGDVAAMRAAGIKVETE